jgi:nucleotide-binding universal stress UspA family protein
MKILVAIDGSKHALRAAKYAAGLVAQLRKPSNVTLVSVHDDTGLRHASALVGREQVADYFRELSDNELKPARKLLDKADVKHDVEIRKGHVAQEIVDCASAGKFDLIVLGAKGRGAFTDLLVGSVAQRVMALAKQPVLLVK